MLGNQQKHSTLSLPASVTNEQTLYQNMHHLNYRLESSIVFVLDEKLNRIVDNKSWLHDTAVYLSTLQAIQVDHCIHSVDILRIHLYDIYEAIIYIQYTQQKQKNEKKKKKKRSVSTATTPHCVSSTFFLMRSTCYLLLVTFAAIHDLPFDPSLVLLKYIVHELNHIDP